MAATLVGALGVRWGCAGFTCSGTGVPTGNIYDGITGTCDSDNFEMKDNEGITKGVYFYNARVDLTLDVTPSSTTMALGLAAATQPLSGTIVTVVAPSSADANIAATGTGTEYVCMSSQKKLVPDGKCVITMNLKKWEFDMTP